MRPSRSLFGQAIRSLSTPPPRTRPQGVPVSEARMAPVIRPNSKKIGLFVTVNTNRRATPANAHALEVAMARVLGVNAPAETRAALFRRNQGEGELILADGPSLTSVHSLEGREGGRLHAHAFLKFKYLREVDGGPQTFWVDYRELRERLRDAYAAAGGQGGLPYVNWRRAGLSADEAYTYIHKEQVPVQGVLARAQEAVDPPRRRWTVANDPGASAAQVRRAQARAVANARRTRQ